MKVIICGGRDYKKTEIATKALDNFHEKNPITLVIEGGAKGADAIGADWARSHSIPVLTFKAAWKTYGKAAGWYRNNDMADELPDFILAFPGGVGTKMMIEIGKTRGIPVVKLP